MTAPLRRLAEIRGSDFEIVPSDRNRNADLRFEAPLHGVEQRETIGCGQTEHGERQQDQRYESNSADPVDIGEHMQGARQDEIVGQESLFDSLHGLPHRRRLDLKIKPTLFHGDCEAPKE